MLSRSVTIGYTIIAVVFLVFVLSTGSGESGQALQDSIVKNGRCIRCDLQNMDFSRRELDGINLSWSNLDGANFCLADLSNSIFIGASLINTQFCGADLSEALLSYARLKNNQFDSAYMEGVIFSGMAGYYKGKDVFSEAKGAPAAKGVFKISPVILPKE